MKNLISSLVVAGVAFLGAEASAQENLLVCQNSGFSLYRCSLTKKLLAAPILEDGTIYETDYTISYSFPCSGHAINVGVATDQEYVPFVMGATNGLLTGVVGNGTLQTYDPDPVTTQRLSFRPGCSLTVSSAKVFPSTNTLVLWTSQAQSQAKIINLSAQLYLLAKDYHALSTWDDAKLNLLKERLEALVTAFPANIHYKTMLATVNNALLNQPPPVSQPELDEAGTEVIAAIRAELDAEVEAGTNLVNRFIRWQAQAEQSLVDALDNVPAV
ncbi:hypothetical protein [Archangium lipolyticum]|uniref:hypothetical protein n=1 Tax=Archangium lipolyticum TaxID=2970465 RepID=UPI002149B26B|nr:hypothetical protein [Archangium lipolyticum]